jgi:hypothetical protein
MLRSLPAALKIQRSELVLVGLAVAAWAFVALGLSMRLAALDAEFPGCLGLNDIGADCSLGQNAIMWWDRTAETMQMIAVGLPVFAGVFIGVPLVGREVETGIAQISWSLARSRSRWLVLQVIPVLLIVLALLAVAAGVGEVLTTARLGGDDPGFQQADSRGFLLLLRGLAAFGIAVFVGARVGRILTGLLLALAVSAVLFLSAGVAMNEWRAAEAEFVRITDVGPGTPWVNGLAMGQVGVLPDGTVVRNLNIEQFEGEVDLNWMLVIPGRDYPKWVGREGALLLGLACAFTALTALGIRHRRPQ